MMLITRFLYNANILPTELRLIIFITDLFLVKETGTLCTGVPREKPQGGGAFFHPFQMRLAKKKAPPPWTILLLLLQYRGFSQKASRVGLFFGFVS